MVFVMKWSSAWHELSVVGKAFVTYRSSQAAAYARDKIGNFQYPPGYRIAVHFAGRYMYMCFAVHTCMVKYAMLVTFLAA